MKARILSVSMKLFLNRPKPKRFKISFEKSSEEEKKVLSKSIESGLDEKKSFPKSLILERRLKWEKKEILEKNFHKKILF